LIFDILKDSVTLTHTIGFIMISVAPPWHLFKIIMWFF